MHRRLRRATLSQLAFPGEGNPNFPWEKSLWDNTVVKTKKQTNKQATKPSNRLLLVLEPDYSAFCSATLSEIRLNTYTMENGRAARLKGQPQF